MKKNWFVRRVVGLMIWMLVAAGLIFRFTVRDTYLRWSVIYYVTPLPALPILFLLAGLAVPPGLSWKRNDKAVVPRSRFSMGRLNLFFGLASLVWAMYSECGYRGQPTTSEDIRLVFWNVARVQAGTSRLAAPLLSWKSSVIALVEADEKYKLKLADWQAALPGYTVVPTRFGGLIAVDGTAAAHPDRLLSAGCYCQPFDLHVRDADFTLLLVDISSDLRCSKRPPLEALAKIAEEFADRPVVIAGDFNTPDDSVWFAPLRTHFREAFRDRGTGYAATWPLPLPVLTLDQVWVNELVDVSQCQHGWTIYSDHRPVVTDMSFRHRR